MVNTAGIRLLLDRPTAPALNQDPGVTLEDQTDLRMRLRESAEDQNTCRSSDFVFTETLSQAFLHRLDRHKIC